MACRLLLVKYLNFYYGEESKDALLKNQNYFNKLPPSLNTQDAAY